VDPVTPRRDPSIARDAVSPLADPGSRLAAVTLDALIPLAPQIALLGVGMAASSGPLIVAASWASWASWIVAVGIDVWLLHRYGQTIGKRIMGLRIVRSDGARATLVRLVFPRTIGPAVISAIPIVGSLFWLIDSLMVFTRDRRTLHDRMADTIVIDLRAPIEEPTALAEVFS
jgi:uncharacterized RDD family membrane protein YckC